MRMPSFSANSVLYQAPSRFSFPTISILPFSMFPAEIPHPFPEGSSKVSMLSTCTSFRNCERISGAGIFGLAGRGVFAGALITASVDTFVPISAGRMAVNVGTADSDPVMGNGNEKILEPIHNPLTPRMQIARRAPAARIHTLDGFFLWGCERGFDVETGVRTGSWLAGGRFISK